jgi:DNA-binding transcriptional MerR regulator
MGALDQITQMKNQGIPEDQIIQNLQEQGVSPKEISDALAQAQIKNAVAGEASPQDYSGENNPQTMQPSIMNQSPRGNLNQTNYSPQTQEISPQTIPQQEYSSQEEYYPQGEYYDEYASSTGGTDTMIEIAEQVFAEKMQKAKKDLQELNEFKTLSETKIENMDERLKRIEKHLDKLQIEILGKVGSYGENLENIKKEMSMMEDSFGKVLKEKSSSTKKKSKK